MTSIVASIVRLAESLRTDVKTFRESGCWKQQTRTRGYTSIDFLNIMDYYIRCLITHEPVLFLGDHPAGVGGVKVVVFPQRCIIADSCA